MRLTVFGANGKVGSLIVKMALRHGHSVTAFVHSESNLSHHPYLTIHRGDIRVLSDVERALSGSQAVISALGSWHAPTKDILSSGMENIIPAMKKRGITRIVSLTGADARTPGDTLSRLHRLSHFAISLFAPKVLRDGEKHIRMLYNSGLDWTVVRSPVMVEFGNPAHYRLSSVRPAPWAIIHRTSVAMSMLDAAERSRNINEAPYISRR